MKVDDDGVGGKEVTCSGCGRKYVCTPSDDYYNSTNATDGVCERCMMTRAFGGLVSGPAPVSISEAQTETLCKKGQGPATCIFVTFSGGGWACAKGSDMEPSIREKFKNRTMLSAGDNCSGPPNFTPTS